MYGHVIKKEEITSQKNALRCDEVWVRRQAGKGGKVREAVLSENEEDKDKECCVCRKCTILLVVQRKRKSQAKKMRFVAAACCRLGKRSLFRSSFVVAPVTRPTKLKDTSVRAHIGT